MRPTIFKPSPLAIACLAASLTLAGCGGGGSSYVSNLSSAINTQGNLINVGAITATTITTQNNNINRILHIDSPVIPIPFRLSNIFIDSIINY